MKSCNKDEDIMCCDRCKKVSGVLRGSNLTSEYICNKCYSVETTVNGKILTKDKNLINFDFDFKNKGQSDLNTPKGRSFIPRTPVSHVKCHICNNEITKGEANKKFCDKCGKITCKLCYKLCKNKINVCPIFF